MDQKSEKILTFELVKNGKELEIHVDNNGLQELIETLIELKNAKGKTHDHMMTPSWSGSELTEQKQNETNTLLNKVSVHVWR